MLLAGGSKHEKLKTLEGCNFAMPYAQMHILSLRYTAELMITTLVNTNYGLH
jgi:hypothetical protein